MTEGHGVDEVHSETHQDAPAGVASWLGVTVVVLIALGVALWTTTWLDPNPKLGRLGGNSGLLLAFMVFAPLLGALFNAMFGARLSRLVSGSIGTASVGLSFLLGLLAFNSMRGLDAGNGAVHSISYKMYDWLALGTFRIPMEFVLDPLSSVMVLVITGVGVAAHLYSIGQSTPNHGRLFAAMNALCCAMLVLVLGSNMVVTLIGWGLVGACTYLLVAHRGDQLAADGAKKAFVINRIGDFALLIGLCLVFYGAGTLDFRQMTSVAIDPAMRGALQAVAPVATLFLLFGCIARSAQVPLHVWLPDTVTAPASASALIHGTTAVIASVYVVARLNAVFALAPVTMAIMMVVGGLTALVAAVFACGQVNLNKILAYVTASQVGLMLMALGAGAFTAGVFHAMTHALLIPLLFLSAGGVVYALNGEHDITKMGGLKSRLTITHLAFAVGTLALAGVPGFAGFFSHDAVLFGVLVNDYTAMSASWLHIVMFVIGVLAVGVTAFAVFRAYFLVFWGDAKDNDAPRSLPMPMMLPLVLLAIFAFACGYIGLPEVLRFGPVEGVGSTFQAWMEQVFRGPRTFNITYGAMFQEEGARSLWGWLTLVASLMAVGAGAAAAFVMYVQRGLKPMSEEAFERQVGQPWVPTDQREDLKGLALVRYRAWQVVTGEDIPVKTDGMAPTEQALVYARKLAVAMLGETMLKQALEIVSAADKPSEEEGNVSLPVRFLRRKGYADLAYNMMFVVPAVLTGRMFHWFVDVLLIDTVLVSGPAWFAESLGAVGRRLQSGSLQRYAAYIVFGFGAILLLMFFR